ncbi:hypothetical protein [Roseovarius aestuarii]|uniref:hypothetical protein n=1 Tax=Roseovarius aestuarii TaxID=475083 RepID=UPI001CBD24AF|nr:hypothetical protein [Roseovarius aestuarii]
MRRTRYANCAEDIAKTAASLFAVKQQTAIACIDGKSILVFATLDLAGRTGRGAIAAIPRSAQVFCELAGMNH